MKECFLLLRSSLLESTFSVPKLGEDPKGAGLFIVMGVCVAVMIAMLIFGRKKDNNGKK